jgi:hypothetical protein
LQFARSVALETLAQRGSVLGAGLYVDQVSIGVHEDKRSAPGHGLARSNGETRIGVNIRHADQKLIVTELSFDFGEVLPQLATHWTGCIVNLHSRRHSGAGNLEALSVASSLSLFLPLPLLALWRARCFWVPGLRLGHWLLSLPHCPE